ncbi:MAG: IS4 family transposase [Pseudomonadota bacterium]|nr:IS4 family transposase [Pseudomonadota bacterium]
MGWAQQEWATADLGDRRLNRRLVKVAQQLADKPTASIPGACGGWADTAGAYRMLSNERFDWRDVLEPHARCTMQRMASQSLVLCLQDTTELDFNGQAIDGLGPLSYEAQRGMYLHPTYAVSVQREPLGVLDAWMWAREPRDVQGQRAGITESVRWIEGYERLAELAGELPATRLMQVGDRESDMAALMQRAQALGWPVDLLVRSQHNRVLPGGQRLWDEVQASASLGEIEFTMPARAGRTARKVRQEVHLKRMRLAGSEHTGLEMTCVIASEVAPPKGAKPVCWRLLTNREVSTLAEALTLIEWYRARWEVEMFFHVLKTGCRVEALQLASLPRMERALALFMVVSWRIAHLMRTGRTCPELNAALMFDGDEIKAAYVLNKKTPPLEPPGLNEVLRHVAMLGGFLARKGDGEPGVKTIWLGLQRVMDFAAGIRFMRDSDTAGTCV